jgi:hypothetical protein
MTAEKVAAGKVVRMIVDFWLEAVFGRNCDTWVLY